MTERLLHRYRIGTTTVEVWEGNVRTMIDGEPPLVAAPNPPDTMRETIDHELMHTWIAHVIAGTPSVTLTRAARHLEATDTTRFEEEIVCSAVLGLRARRGDHRRPWDDHDVLR